MSAHIAIYSGKTVVVDYVKPERQFRVACRRIIDNGASGMVVCPDGKQSAVSPDCHTARLVRKLEMLEKELQ